MVSEIFEFEFFWIFSYIYQYILNFYRSDLNTKKVQNDNDNSKKNRSLEDEAEKQMEMKLLDSPLPEPEIKQPKKEVIGTHGFFLFYDIGNI